MDEFSSSRENISSNFKNSIEHVQKNLINFGLSQNQSKVYVFLSKNEFKTAPEISQALKIARTETYHLLNSLENKGIVFSNLEKPVKFKALPLDKCIPVLLNNEKSRINELEEQKIELVELWKTIPTIHSGDEKTQENRFQTLKGKNSILGKLKQLLEKPRKQVLVLGNESDYMKFFHTDFFDNLTEIKVDLKILTTSSEKTAYVFDDIPHKHIKRYDEMPGENLFFIVKDDSEVVFFIRNMSELMAVWTNSKSFVESFKLLFSLIWNKSNYLRATDDLLIGKTDFDFKHKMKELEQEKLILDVLQRYTSKFKKSYRKKSKIKN